MVSPMFSSEKQFSTVFCAKGNKKTPSNPYSCFE
jgi:hypothetical protein